MKFRWMGAVLLMTATGCNSGSGEANEPIVIPVGGALGHGGTGGNLDPGGGQGGAGGQGGGGGQGAQGGVGGQGGGGGQGAQGGVGGQGGAGGAGGQGGAGGSVCTPDCTNRICGPDGCGGTCGPECADGGVCDDGQCVDGGCPAGTFECDGVCSALIDDADNCGSCGEVCPRYNGVLTQCVDAECYFNCPGFEGQAVNIDFWSDPNNCGGCGNVCPAPDGFSGCIDAVCACPVTLHFELGDGAACNGRCQVVGANCADGCCPDVSANAVNMGPLNDGEHGTASLTLDAVTHLDVVLNDGEECPDVQVQVFLRLDRLETTWFPVMDGQNFEFMGHRERGDHLGPIFQRVHHFTSRVNNFGERTVCRSRVRMMQAGEYTIRVTARDPLQRVRLSVQRQPVETLDAPGVFEDRHSDGHERHLLNLARDLDAWIYFSTDDRNACHEMRIFTSDGQLVASERACSNNAQLGQPPVIRMMLPQGRYIIETDVFGREDGFTLSVLDGPPIPEGAITERERLTVAGDSAGWTLFFPRDEAVLIRTTYFDPSCDDADTTLELARADDEHIMSSDDVDPLSKCSMVYGQLDANTGYNVSVRRRRSHFQHEFDVVIGALYAGARQVDRLGDYRLDLDEFDLERFQIGVLRDGRYTLSVVDADGGPCSDRTTLELVQGTRRAGIDLETNRDQPYCSRIEHDFEAGEDYVLLVRGRGWRAADDVVLRIEGENLPDPDPEPGPQPEPNPGPRAAGVIDGRGTYDRPGLAAGQEDVFEVRVAEEMIVTVRTAGPGDGPCPGDTELGVAFNGVWQAFNDDAPEGGVCSSLQGRFAPDFVPTVHVGGYNGRAVPPYSIVVE